MKKFYKLLGWATAMAVSMSSFGQMKMLGHSVNGGDHDNGTIYTVDSDGNAQQIYSFYRGAGQPYTNGFIMRSNGNLIATPAEGGGSGDAGMVIEYDPILDTVYYKVSTTYANGSRSPYGDLVHASDGNYYGMSYFSGVFKYDTAAEDCVPLHGTTLGTGSRMWGSPIEIEPGVLITMTQYGGANADGSISTYNYVTGQDATLYSFAAATDGELPRSHLTLHSNGLLYGWTYQGAGNNKGAVFKYDYTNNIFTKIEDLPATAYHGRLAEADNGNLVGNTVSGGAINVGMIFEVDVVADTIRTLYDFANLSGNSPLVQPVKGANNKFYGVTNQGGTYNDGTLYEYDYDNDTLIVLHDFGGPMDTRNPQCHVFVHPTNNKIYGMGRFGGEFGQGVMYEYDLTTSTYRIVHQFIGAQEGDQPHAEMIKTSSGRIFGTTLTGGPSEAGVLYEVDPINNTYTALQHFRENMANETGASPISALTEAPDGSLYGVCRFGGSSNQGTIYTYDPVADSLYALYHFTTSFGSRPYAGLTWNADSTLLYGTTTDGGTLGDGVIFTFDPVTLIATSVHDFDATADGKGNDDLLYLASNGIFYGASDGGGASNRGTVFSFDPATNTYTNHYDFTATDGGNCENTFVEGRNGDLFSTTRTGGSWGTIFKYNYIQDTFSIVHATVTTDGQYPYGNLLLAPDSNSLFGTFYNDLTYQTGQVYQYDLINDTLNVIYQMDSAVGMSPRSGLLLLDCTTPTPSASNFSGADTTCLNRSEMYIFNSNDAVSWILGSGGTLSSSGDTATVIWNTSGNHTLTVEQQNVCGSGSLNSTVFVDTLPTVSISQDGDSLVASAGTYTSYQWQLNGSNITDATQASYTPTENGDYRLVVTNDNGCAGTSNSVTIASFDGLSTPIDQLLRVYPNPNEGQFTLQLQRDHRALVTIFNSMGEEVAAFNMNSMQEQVQLNLQKGLYFIKISNPNSLGMLPMIVR